MGRFKHEIAVLTEITKKVLDQDYTEIKDIRIIEQGVMRLIPAQAFIPFVDICTEILKPFQDKKLPKNFTGDTTVIGLVKLVKILEDLS